eukprot:scaffold24586_cov39-Phaeocystis_antarctica.AAC.2
MKITSPECLNAKDHGGPDPGSTSLSLNSPVLVVVSPPLLELTNTITYTNATICPGSLVNSIYTLNMASVPPQDHCVAASAPMQVLLAELLDLHEQPACARFERPAQLRIVHVLRLAPCKIELPSERRVREGHPEVARRHHREAEAQAAHLLQHPLQW